MMRSRMFIQTDRRSDRQIRSSIIHFLQKHFRTKKDTFDTVLRFGVSVTDQPRDQATDGQALLYYQDETHQKKSICVKALLAELYRPRLNYLVYGSIHRK